MIDIAIKKVSRPSKQLRVPRCRLSMSRLKRVIMSSS